ncbi:MAG: ligase-associated DNA damage response endonuclease PdeM [Sediminibacterium sp.]|nr:ligase-associated DNA damage response endonuclease PdeM [Sediminibacterium sp.]
MNTPPLLHMLSNQHCWLSAQRCMYWEEKKMLILADLHWGKTGHFRKHGIAVPTGISKEDLQRLTQQIMHFRPEQVMIVGDMFHSYANKELEQWLRWRNDFSAIAFMLIKGNHDILSLDWYAAANIQVFKEQHLIAPFTFIHDAATLETNAAEENTIISGHLHPGIAMKGRGKQHLRFPCFYHAAPQFYLPAFSYFSDMAMIQPKKNQAVFAIVNDQIMSL